jgi:hypothetical protein
MEKPGEFLTGKSLDICLEFINLGHRGSLPSPHAGAESTAGTPALGGMFRPPQGGYLCVKTPLLNFPELHLRGGPQSNFSRREMTLHYAAHGVIAGSL